MPLSGVPLRQVNGKGRKPVLKDSFGRKIDYLRISVTDRCNLRCRYCMPEGIERVPMSEVLSYEEIAFVCARAAELGITRLKVTGGEPLVRKDCPVLVSMLAKIPGITQVTLTTNGVLLAEQLDDLLRAGLGAVNVSLDTTDREQYRAVTGADELDRVLASLRLAAERLPVKINCVVQRGLNDDAPERLVRLARELPVDVRFIELMPLGAARDLRAVPNSEVLERIERQFGKTAEDPGKRGNGPAVYRRLEGCAGRIGFISAVHGKFCDSCNRLRLTSVGELKPCLCYGDTVPLREILRDSLPDREERIREKIREAVRIKPGAHCFERREQVTETREMVKIGG